MAEVVVIVVYNCKMRWYDNNELDQIKPGSGKIGETSKHKLEFERNPTPLPSATP